MGLGGQPKEDPELQKQIKEQEQLVAEQKSEFEKRETDLKAQQERDAAKIRQQQLSVMRAGFAGGGGSLWDTTLG